MGIARIQKLFAGAIIFTLAVSSYAAMALQALDLDGQSCYPTELNCVAAPFIYEETTLRQTFINKCAARVYIRVCYQGVEEDWRCSSHGIHRDKKIEIITSLPVNDSNLKVAGSLLPENDQACANKQKDWFVTPKQSTL